MNYLLFLAVVVIIAGMMPEKYGLRWNNYKNYILLCGVLMAFIMGFRHKYTGSGDTYIYWFYYEGLQKYQTFGEYYNERLAEGNFLFSESGFYLFMWLLGKVFRNGQALVFFTSIFITWSTCRYVRKHSIDPPLALMVYVCLGMLTFNMNGMRQALAMSICLFAFDYVKERNIWKFGIILLIAMQFHKSAICYAPMYILPILKNTKGNWFFYMCGLAVFLLFIDKFVAGFNDLTGKEYDTEQSFESGGWTVIMLYVIAIILAILHPENLNNDSLRMALFGTITGIAIYVGRYFSAQSMERVSYYYFYSMMLLFPEAINGLRKNDRSWLRILFILFAVALFWYRLRGGLFRYFTLCF